MAKLKADFLQAYHDANGVPVRSWMIAHVDQLTKLASPFSLIYNWVVEHRILGQALKHMLGFAQERALPKIARQSLRSWFKKRRRTPLREDRGIVYFFFDEFTNYNDVEIGKKAILLLEGLGYSVGMVNHPSSGRALISKGLLREAKKIANKQVHAFAPLIGTAIALVGVEPSAILSFRDEYVDLVDEALIPAAETIASQAFTIEEFLYKEILAGKITPDLFAHEEMEIALHTHCQQKAWGLQDGLAFVLRFLPGRTVHVIPSGCCGMAGSFGYEKEHYALSQAIGNLVLFPYIRKKKPQEIVVASGTSCRHQIKEGVRELAVHPVEILYAALLNRQ